MQMRRLSPLVVILPTVTVVASLGAFWTVIEVVKVDTAVAVFGWFGIICHANPLC